MGATGTELGKLAWKLWGKKGCPVFPCSDNKRPLTTRGHNDASTKKDEILRMFGVAGERAKYIGLATGEAAGFFVLDLDLYKDGAAQFKKVLKKAGHLPKTRVNRTVNGGQHYFYRVPAGQKFPRNSVPSDGVEVRGEGGYVIVPPSPGYTVEKDREPSVAPVALIKRLQRSDRAFKSQTVGQLEAQVLEGRSFHEALTLIAAKRHGMGHDPVEVQARLLDIMNSSVAASPLHQRHDRWEHIMEGDELGRIASSAFRKFNTKAKSSGLAEQGKEKGLHKGDATAGGLFTNVKKEKKSKSKKAKKKSSSEDTEHDFPFKRSYHVTDVEKQDDKPYIIYPLIMQSDVLVLSAEPKAGKTLTSMTVALHAATGTAMSDKRLVPMNEKGETDKVSVLYFALEGQGAIRKRTRAWMKYYEEEFGKAFKEDDIHLYVVEQSINLADEDSKQDTVDKISLAEDYFKEKGWGPIGLVVFDTLTKAMPGKDQNSVEDTSAVFETVDLLRELSVDAAVMFVHHNSKTGGPRGSSNILAEPDTVLNVKKLPPRVVDNEEQTIVSLNVNMARAIDDDQTYDFSMKMVELGINNQGMMDSAPVLVLLKELYASESMAEQSIKARATSGKEAFYTFVWEKMSDLLEVQANVMHREIMFLPDRNPVKSFYFACYVGKGMEDVNKTWDIMINETPGFSSDQPGVKYSDGELTLDLISALSAPESEQPAKASQKQRH